MLSSCLGLQSRACKKRYVRRLIRLGAVIVAKLLEHYKYYICTIAALWLLLAFVLLQYIILGVALDLSSVTLDYDFLKQAYLLSKTTIY